MLLFSGLFLDEPVDHFSSSVKNALSMLIEITLNVDIAFAFVDMDVLKMLTLPIHELGMFLHCLKSLIFCLNVL